MSSHAHGCRPAVCLSGARDQVTTADRWEIRQATQQEGTRDQLAKRPGARHRSECSQRQYCAAVHYVYSSERPRAVQIKSGASPHRPSYPVPYEPCPECVVHRVPHCTSVPCRMCTRVSCAVSARTVRIAIVAQRLRAGGCASMPTAAPSQHAPTASAHVYEGCRRRPAAQRRLASRWVPAIATVCAIGRAGSRGVCWCGRRRGVVCDS